VHLVDRLFFRPHSDFAELPSGPFLLHFGIRWPSCFFGVRTPASETVEKHSPLPFLVPKNDNSIDASLAIFSQFSVCSFSLADFDFFFFYHHFFSERFLPSSYRRPHPSTFSSLGMPQSIPTRVDAAFLLQAPPLLSPCFLFYRGFFLAQSSLSAGSKRILPPAAFSRPTPQDPILVGFTLWSFFLLVKSLDPCAPYLSFTRSVEQLPGNTLRVFGGFFKERIRRREVRSRFFLAPPLSPFDLIFSVAS